MRVSKKWIEMSEVMRWRCWPNKSKVWNKQLHFGWKLVGVKCGGCIGLTTLPPPVSRLSIQCGILSITTL
jgi:aconitase A